jgi:predicted PurR-regulated permease PerM
MRRDMLTWAIRGAGLAVGVGFILLLGGLAVAASSMLLLLFLAILLGSALEPVIGWIRSRTPLGRGAAILVTYATFFVAVILLVLIVVPAAFTQFNQITAELPPLLDEVRTWAADLRPRGLGTSITALMDSLEATVRPAPPDPDQVVQVGLTVAEAVVSVATLLALVFFWLVEHARIQRFVLAFLPAGRRAGTREAWNEVENRLGLWVRGQLILMGTIGVATGILYTIIGLPSAMLLALIAAITEAIPLVGPLIGAVPAVLVAATVSPETALLVAAIYLLIQFVEGNVLVPIVMRNTIGISPFLVLVALLIGGAAGGLVGALLGVPVAAAIVVILERLQARDVPVAQDPASLEEPTPGDARAMGSSLPDAAARSGSRPGL